MGCQTVRSVRLELQLKFDPCTQGSGGMARDLKASLSRFPTCEVFEFRALVLISHVRLCAAVNCYMVA